jgi:hypothetical protein
LWYWSWTQGLHFEPLHQPPPFSFIHMCIQHLGHFSPPALFCEGFFEIGSHRTICLGWLRTTILLICASWVARITGASHWCPAIPHLFVTIILTGMRCYFTMFLISISLMSSDIDHFLIYLLAICMSSFEKCF